MGVNVRPNRHPIDYLMPFSNSRKMPSSRVTGLKKVAVKMVSLTSSGRAFHSVGPATENVCLVIRAVPQGCCDQPSEEHVLGLLQLSVNMSRK